MSFRLEQFDAVIFDMDGVLINSEPLWEESDLRVFRRDLGLAAYTKEYRTQFLGVPMAEEMKIVAANFKIAQEKIPFIIEARKKSLMELYREKLELFPGARNILEFLHGYKKIALASSSSKKLIDFVVDRFNIRNYFTILVSSEEVRRGKPSPDIFLHTARKLMVKPKQCLVVEDSINGIKAGKRAGMKVIGLPHTVKKKEDLHEADWVFDDLQSLRRKFQNI